MRMSLFNVPRIVSNFWESRTPVFRKGFLSLSSKAEQRSARKERKKKSEETAFMKNDRCLVEEEPQETNQLSNLPDDMKNYIQWLQGGLVSNSEVLKEGHDKSSKEKASDLVLELSFGETDGSQSSVSNLPKYLFLDELFRRPGARYESIDDKRLLIMNKTGGNSMTKVVLLMEKNCQNK